MRSPPVQVECSYPVPPIRLYEVLTDLDFLIARNERYGGVGTPTVEQTGDALVVTTVRRIPLEHAPAVAHRFLGDGQLVQVDRWRRPRPTGPWLRSRSTPAGSRCRYAAATTSGRWMTVACT